MLRTYFWLWTYKTLLAGLARGWWWGCICGAQDRTWINYISLHLSSPFWAFKFGPIYCLVQNPSFAYQVYYIIAPSSFFLPSFSVSTFQILAVEVYFHSETIPFLKTKQNSALHFSITETHISLLVHLSQL